MPREAHERQSSVNNESNQFTIAVPSEVERQQSADISSIGMISRDSFLQSENEALRRLLMGTQELLIQRNERLANPNLESPVQTSNNENKPSTPKSQTYKIIQKRSRCLPREQEMELTIEVVETRVVDGAGDVGMYTGTLLNNLPHGKGRMVYDKYRSYTGEWKKGHWHGKGHLISRAFDYKGMFVYDIKTGLGVMKWSDGRFYEGEFWEDEMHGKGLLVYPDGSAYKGEFRHDKWEGKGEAKRSEM